MHTRTPKTLTVSYDVSNLTDPELDALLGEALVQAEDSGEHPAVAVAGCVVKLPLDVVRPALEVAADDPSVWPAHAAPEYDLSLVVEVDHFEHATVPLKDGDDSFNAEAERGALDRAYEAKESNPDATVTILIDRTPKGVPDEDEPRVVCRCGHYHPPRRRHEASPCPAPTCPCLSYDPKAAA